MDEKKTKKPSKPDSDNKKKSRNNSVSPVIKKKSIKKDPLSSAKKSVTALSVKKETVKAVSKKKASDSDNKNLPETINEEQIDPRALARGDNAMTIVEHLTEMRSRLIAIVSSFFILICIAFYFSDLLVHIINKPFLVTGNQLHVFTLAAGFIIRMKVSAALTLLILIPLIVYHIWRFISPAIETPDRHFSRIIVFFSIILFYVGVIFVFFVLPSAIKVLLGFINNSMFSTIGADDYLHFIFFLSFVMGVLFELPVLILVLTRIGLITPQFLIRKRKYAFIIIWLVAAVVTPGSDILSQMLIGVPLMFLYEISILISKFALIRKKRKELILKNS